MSRRTSASLPALDGRIVLGWRECVALPDWNVACMVAKLDTGACISAIDVASFEELPGDRVRFDIVVDRDHVAEHARVEAPIVRRAHIRTSLGSLDHRLIVATRVRIGPVEKIVEFGLVSRQHMLCRMLLGRAALAPEFMVAPDRRYLLGRRPGARRRRRSGR